MKVAIYCGSSMGTNEKIVEKVKDLGKFLATNGVDLVYGGGKVGLMGVIADTFLEHGAQVYGVLPKKLQEKELAHNGVTKLTIVDDMHERKAMMAHMADAFITLPGGAGTLEEIIEVWVAAQLGYHNKPCAFYNINNFYDELFEMFENMSNSGFLKEDYIDMIINTEDKEELLEKIKNYTPPKQKWDK